MPQVCASDKHQQTLYFVNPVIQLLTGLYFSYFLGRENTMGPKNGTWPGFEPGVNKKPFVW